MQDSVLLKREIEAIQIPSGETITLPVGTEARITQALGGTWTIVTAQGLARVRKNDADALGIDDEAEKKAAATVEVDGDLEAAVWQQLKTVYDPEIPVDIVNLGLVYDCNIQEVEEKNFVNVKMTLTAPGCGMGPTIAADAESKIMSVQGIQEAKVELVWDPPWSQDMISEEGRMKLGMI